MTCATASAQNVDKVCASLFQNAQKLWSEGDLSRSLQKYWLYAECNPSDKKVYYDIAAAFAAQRKLDSAFQYLSVAAAALGAGPPKNKRQSRKIYKQRKFPCVM